MQLLYRCSFRPLRRSGDLLTTSWRSRQLPNGARIGPLHCQRWLECPFPRSRRLSWACSSTSEQPIRLDACSDLFGVIALRAVSRTVLASDRCLGRSAGARWIAIPGLVLTTCAFASFSFANGSISQWLGLGWGGISFLLVAVFFVDARGLRHSRSEDGTGVMASAS